MAFQRYDRTSMGHWNNWRSAKYPGISHFPNYFIGPLVCWSHAGSIVPLKGPSKCLMARARVVGIAKIPRTRSRKYRPPGIPKKPSTKPSTFIQSVYTVFTLWNTESVCISVFWQDRYTEPWLLWWWGHSPSQNTAIIPNTAVFWWRYTDYPKIEYRPSLITLWLKLHIMWTDEEDRQKGLFGEKYKY